MYVYYFLCIREKVLRPVKKVLIFFFCKMFYVKKYLKITKIIVGQNIINDR